MKLELRFDAVGEIVEERQTVGGGRTYVVKSTHDAGGLRTLLETSLGFSLGTTRDALGDVKELRDPGGTVVRFEQDPAGTFLRRQLAGGASVVDGFDAVGRLKRRQVLRRGAVSTEEREPEWLGGAAPGTIHKSWEYSPINEITQISTATDGTTELDYDLRRHLKRRRHGGAEETWSADSVSNYSEAGPGAPSRVYLPGGRIAKRGDTEYDWDDRGFLVGKRRRRADGGWDRWTYAWSAADSGALRQAPLRPAGRPTRWSSTTTRTLRRRVAKRVFTRRVPKATLTSFPRRITSGIQRSTSSTRSSSRARKRRRRARTCFLGSRRPHPHRPPGRERTGPGVHYVGDHHGVPDEIVDGSGNVLGRMTRDDVWRVRHPRPGRGPRLRSVLPGQLADDDIGLHYNRYRYYDPETGNSSSAPIPSVSGGWEPTGPLRVRAETRSAGTDSLGLQHNMWGAAWDASGNPIPLPNGGQYQSGQRGSPDPDPPTGGARNRKNDTEQQFLRDLSKANTKGGGQAVLNGQYPPCPSCHRAMQAHAQNTGTQITYNHPGPPPQSIVYGQDKSLPPGQYPPPTGNVPPGYAQNPDGSYCNYGFGPNNRTNRPPPGCGRSLRARTIRARPWAPTARDGTTPRPTIHPIRRTPTPISPALRPALPPSGDSLRSCSPRGQGVRSTTMPKKASAIPGVDWKTLKTVSGPATRVPRLVELLVAGKTPEDRDEAWLTLHQSLYANGTVSPAGPLPPSRCSARSSRAARTARTARDGRSGDVPTTARATNACPCGASDAGRWGLHRGRRSGRGEQERGTLRRHRSGRSRPCRGGVCSRMGLGSFEAVPPGLAQAIATECRRRGDDELRLLCWACWPAWAAPPRTTRISSMARPRLPRLSSAEPPRSRGCCTRAVSPALVRDVVAFLQTKIDRQVVCWCAGQAARIVAAVGRRAGLGAELAGALAPRASVRRSPPRRGRRSCPCC